MERDILIQEVIDELFNKKRLNVKDYLTFKYDSKNFKEINAEASFILEFLLNKGIVRNISNKTLSCELTEFGNSIVIDFGNWTKYLEHVRHEIEIEEDRKSKEIEKLDLDLKNSKFQLKTRWIAVASIVISLISLLISIFK